MTASSIVMILGGALLLGWGVRQRLGRSEGARAWVGNRTHERAVLVLRPALGLLLVVTGLLPVAGDAHGVRVAVGLVAVLALVVALGWGVLPLPMPRWSLPDWYLRKTTGRPKARAHG